MAIVTTSQNLTAVTYTAGEIIEVRNGATLTIDSTPAVRPGTIQCITSGKVRIQNSSPTTPLVLELENANRDLRFESNGVLEIRGAPMEIGTSTGSQMTFDFSTLYGGVITDVTYVEVETAPSSGVFFPWHIANITPRFYKSELIAGGIGSATTSLFSGDIETFFFDSDTRILTSGDGTNGKLVPNGCKVRIPNILISHQDWKLDASAALEIRSSGAPTGGTFTLTIKDGRTGAALGTTAAIAYNASAATINTAIEAITGAGTITNTGGPLPAVVTLGYAGAYAQVPLSIIANSSVTGGTLPIVYAVDRTANQSTIDTNPSGTIDAEWCAFSTKIFFQPSAFTNVKLTSVGTGSAYLSILNSLGNMQLKNVSNTSNPYTYTFTANSIANITGTNTSIDGLVLTGPQNTLASFVVIPNLLKCQDIKGLMYGSRTNTIGHVLYISNISSTPIIRPRAIGGRFLLVNLIDNVVVDPSVSDRASGTSITAQSTASIDIGNSENLTIANLTKANKAAARYSALAVSSITNNLNLINGTYDCDNNSIAGIYYVGTNCNIQNYTFTNVLSAGRALDNVSTFISTGLVARKIFITGGATSPDVESFNDSILDLVGCEPDRFNIVNTGINDFVGGNFMSMGTAPTTGHVAFGAFGSGKGMVTTGSAYTNQAGSVMLPTSGDTAEITMTFAMHGITAFRNLWPRLVGETADGASRIHRVINDGGVTGGTWTATIYDADNVLIGTTAAIAYNATLTATDAAIEAVTGAGTVASSGSLTAGFSFTFNGQVRRMTVDGTNLTGGTKPGTLDHLCFFTRTVDGERHDNLEFAVRVPGTSWSSYQLLTPTNLAGAISALSGYDPGGSGLEMRLKVTAPTTSNYTRLQLASIFTDIDPDLWVVKDSTITFAGPSATDVVRVRKVSAPTVDLYTFTGGGTHDIEVGANFGEEVFFLREDSTGTVLMRTLPETKVLSYGNLGTVNLFYGSEVQLAQSAEVTAIKAKVDAYLDAAISSRLSAAGYTAPDNASITAIKAKTDNLPAAPADVSDIPTATEIADTVLRRSTANVEASGTGDPVSLKSLYGMVAQGVHNTQVTGATLTVTKSDDATVLGTRTVTTNPNAEPITGIDSD